MPGARKIKEIIVRKWIIYMCYLNDAFGGISEKELYVKKNKAITQDYGDLMGILHKLQREGFVEENLVNGMFHVLFKTTQRGRDFIFKRTITSEADFHKVINLAPPEYALKTRTTNIEKFLLFAVFTFMAYTMTLLLLQSQVMWALLFMGLTFCLLPFTIAYFMRIALLYIFHYTEKIFKNTASVMMTKDRLIGAILTCVLIIVAICLAFYAGSLRFGWAGMAGLGTSIIVYCVFGGGIKNLREWYAMLSSWIKRTGDSIYKEVE